MTNWIDGQKQQEKLIGDLIKSRTGLSVVENRDMYGPYDFMVENKIRLEVENAGWTGTVKSNYYNWPYRTKRSTTQNRRK